KGKTQWYKIAITDFSSISTWRVLLQVMITHFIGITTFPYNFPHHIIVVILCYTERTTYQVRANSNLAIRVDHYAFAEFDRTVTVIFRISFELGPLYKALRESYADLVFPFFNVLTNLIKGRYPILYRWIQITSPGVHWNSDFEKIVKVDNAY